jgi:hypothetical protein
LNNEYFNVCTPGTVKQLLVKFEDELWGTWGNQSGGMPVDKNAILNLKTKQNHIIKKPIQYST